MSCTCDKMPSPDSENLVELQPEKKAELETYLKSLPLSDNPDRNRGFLIQSLHKAQGIFGYLPQCVQLFVADKLHLHLAEVYGVISFYSYFTEKPVGRYKINICTGTACFVKGANKIVDEFKRYLNIKEGETTPDGKFTLGALRCVGACSLAPVVMVNDRVYGNVTAKLVADILNDCAE